jgi:translation initiation factor 3 subunit G
LEEIFLEKARAQPKSEAEKAADPLAAMASAQTSLLVCRTCGKKGDHWTSKCPYKDLANDGSKPPEEEASGMPRRTAGGYVPPSMREGATGAGATMLNRRDDNSIRVSNLSEDTREQDLQELFRPFGPVTRIYVAFNRETGESRGFAFVNMVNKEDGERAIAKLDGYGYDNLILRVEWAEKRPERQ